MLQKGKEQLSEQHEEAMQKLQAKYETDLSHLHHEHGLSAAKVHVTPTHPRASPSGLLDLLLIESLRSPLQASEVIADLEKTVAQIKQQFQDSEHRRHQQVRV